MERIVVMSVEGSRSVLRLARCGQGHHFEVTRFTPLEAEPEFELGGSLSVSTLVLPEKDCPALRDGGPHLPRENGRWCARCGAVRATDVEMP